MLFILLFVIINILFVAVCDPACEITFSIPFSFSQLSDVSRMLRDIMQYWIHLPRKLCVDRESGLSEADRCWNGMSVDR